MSSFAISNNFMSIENYDRCRSAASFSKNSQKCSLPFAENVFDDIPK